MKAGRQQATVDRIKEDQRTLQFTRKRRHAMATRFVRQVLHPMKDTLPPHKGIPDIILQGAGALPRLAQDQTP